MAQMPLAPLLPDWNTTLAGQTWSTLVIGNGVSINVWGNFKYDSLYKVAEPNLSGKAN